MRIIEFERLNIVLFCSKVSQPSIKQRGTKKSVSQFFRNCSRSEWHSKIVSKRVNVFASDWGASMQYFADNVVLRISCNAVRQFVYNVICVVLVFEENIVNDIDVCRFFMKIKIFLKVECHCHIRLFLLKRGFKQSVDDGVESVDLT